MTRGEARRHHAADYEQCRHHGRSTRIDEFLETEFESQREQQHDDAYLRPEVDVGFGRNRGEICEVRAGKKACDDIAQHHGLLEPFEDDGRDGSEYEDERKVSDKALDVEGSGGCVCLNHGRHNQDQDRSAWLEREMVMVGSMLCSESKTSMKSECSLMSITRFMRVVSCS